MGAGGGGAAANPFAAMGAGGGGAAANPFAAMGAGGGGYGGAAPPAGTAPAQNNPFAARGLVLVGVCLALRLAREVRDLEKARPWMPGKGFRDSSVYSYQISVFLKSSDGHSRLSGDY